MFSVVTLKPQKINGNDVPSGTVVQMNAVDASKAIVAGLVKLNGT